MLLKSSATTAVSNKLLSMLPAEDRERIGSRLTPVRLPFRNVIYKEGAIIDDVYFPGGGTLSLTKTMENGATAEVGTIGNEGMIGSAVFFGDPLSNTEAFVQVQADQDSHKLSVAAFMAEMERHGAFFNCVIRHHQALAIQIQQTAVCNNLHSAEQRLARWLLMTRDRVGTDDLKLTHEFLAYMLGVTRPTVTLVIGPLQRAGLIATHRGVITIEDRKGLEAASCECYAAVKTNFSRLFPEIPGSAG